VACLALMTVAAHAQQTPSPAPPSNPPPTSQPATPDEASRKMPGDAKVYIIWPSDGAVIKGGFWIRMGLSNAGVAPANTVKLNTGHHHLLIDSDLPPLDEPIPNDKQHLHFGLGQTEA